MKNQDTCPICNNKVESISKNKFFPFCSERCKIQDLGNWASGKYFIESTEKVKDEERED